MATPAQIKKLHALKSALKMDEETYRTRLSFYSVKSSKDRSFTTKKADELIKDMERDAVSMGVWEKRKLAKRAKPTRRPADDPQSKMLRALWIELHELDKVLDPSEAALIKFVKNLVKVDDLGWLTNRQVTVCKKALNEWLTR